MTSKALVSAGHGRQAAHSNTKRPLKAAQPRGAATGKWHEAGLRGPPSFWRSGALSSWRSGGTRTVQTGRIRCFGRKRPDKRWLKLWARRKRQIKVALLDQSVLSGVGNIYACEALFLAQISPFRQSKSLTRAERNRLLRATETVLKRAVELGGTSFSDYEQPDGSRGENFGHRHVFQRTNEPCRKCATPIGHKVQHGRSTFFCGRCQKCRG